MQQLINAISNGNKRAFSQLVGVTPTVIENIVGTRKGKPGYELLEKIAFSIENINTDWLLTGRGSMLRNSKTSEETTVGDVPNSVPTSPAEESVIYKMYQDEKAEKKEKEAKIDALQSELRSVTAELAVLKAKYPESPAAHPEGLGSSETAPHAHSHPHSPTSEHYHGSSLPPHQENQ